LWGFCQCLAAHRNDGQSLFFEHKILQENEKTYIQHSVRLEKDALAVEDLGFLSGVFADVPGSMLKIKRKVEK